MNLAPAWSVFTLAESLAAALSLNQCIWMRNLGVLSLCSGVQDSVRWSPVIQQESTWRSNAYWITVGSFYTKRGFSTAKVFLLLVPGRERAGGGDLVKD